MTDPLLPLRTALAEGRPVDLTEEQARAIVEHADATPPAWREAVAALLAVRERVFFGRARFKQALATALRARITMATNQDVHRSTC